jgi:hypothetical protein
MQLIRLKPDKIAEKVSPDLVNNGYLKLRYPEIILSHINSIYRLKISLKNIFFLTFLNNYLVLSFHGPNLLQI